MEKNICVSNSKIDNSRLFSIAYNGTISSWFDFEAVNKAVESIDNLIYQIIVAITDDIKETVFN